MYKMILSIFG